MWHYWKDEEGDKWELVCFAHQRKSAVVAFILTERDGGMNMIFNADDFGEELVAITQQEYYE